MTPDYAAATTTAALFDTSAAAKLLLTGLQPRPHCGSRGPRAAIMPFPLASWEPNCSAELKAARCASLSPMSWRGHLA